MRRRRPSGALVASVLAVALVAGACGGGGSPAEAPRDQLRVLAPEGFAVPEAAVEAFEAAAGVPVAVLRVPDAAALVDEVRVGRDHPPADLVVGLGPVELADLLGEEDLLAEVDLPPDAAGAVDDRLLRGLDGRAVPVRRWDLCLVAHPDLVAEGRLPARFTRADLLDALEPGELVLPDPARSRHGAWLLLALAARAPSDPDVVAEARLEVLRPRPILGRDLAEVVFSILRSPGRPAGPPAAFAPAALPAAMELFAADAPEDPALLVAPDGCVRVADHAVIPARAERRDLAVDFLDRLFEPDAQRGLVDGLGAVPVRDDVDLGDDWDRLAGRTARPAVVGVDIVADHLADWRAGWSAPLDPDELDEPEGDPGDGDPVDDGGGGGDADGSDGGGAAPEG